LKLLSLGASRQVSACADPFLLRDNVIVGEGRLSAQGSTGWFPITAEQLRLCFSVQSL